MSAPGVGQTNLPEFHPPITESLDDAEYRLAYTSKGFVAAQPRILTARAEIRSRRADAMDDAASEWAMAEAAD